MNNNLFDLNYNPDFNTTIKNLSDKKICPYYYFLELIKSSNPNILIVTYKDFLDIKSRIQIMQILNNSNSLNEYKLIFDECANLDNILSELYNVSIDDNLLFHSINQLFLLREKTMKFNNNEKDVEMKESGKELEEPENEFISYNGICNSSTVSNSIY